MAANLTNKSEFDSYVSASPKTVCFFWADFHETSKLGGLLDVFFQQLAGLYPGVQFAKVDAESASELAEQLQITVVPTFVLMTGANVVDKLEGADSAELAKRVDAFSKGVISNSAAVSTQRNGAESLDDRLKSLINRTRVMLFMKGNPETPRCGFSRKTVALLNEENITFGSFDILQDNEVREGLKEYSNWPTYPQLYVDGKLMGGLDILKEMQEEGPLGAQLGLAPGAGGSLNDRLAALIRSAPVMLFMKGNAETPRCGFSAKTVALLNEHSIAFSTFDILEDNEVRQGLKEFSNWPTYPQIYVSGKLIGGLDILQEMAEDGGLAEQLGVPKADPNVPPPAPAAASVSESGPSPTALLQARMHMLINSAPVMLFMKGTPEAPRCAYSEKAVVLLRGGRVPFNSFNILEDDEIRQGLKAQYQWPTFPQLFVNGALRGGVGLLEELQGAGDLASQLGVAATPEGDLNTRITALLNRSRVMLFMKGTPSEPRCGFSRQTVALLGENAFQNYDTFDILSDNEIRQGLKEYSNWPTYPQLYIDGKLIGGLDILKELAEEGELTALAAAPAAAASS